MMICVCLGSYLAMVRRRIIPPLNPIRHTMKRKILFILPLSAALQVQADTLYWDGSGGSPGGWATAANWSTDEGASSPDPTVAPGAGDDVVFNTSVHDADTIVTTGLAISARSLTFNNTGVTTVRSTGSARNLQLGAGGITVDAGAGLANLGGSSNTLSVRIEENQRWTNNSNNTGPSSASALRIHNAISGPLTGTAPVTLTISNTSTGGTSFNNSLSDGPGGGVVKLVVDSPGTGFVTLAGGTYSGGLEILRGTVSVNSSLVAGSGSATLASSVGTTSTLRVNHAGAVANNIISGGAGTNVLDFISTSGTLDGDVTLDHHLNLGIRSAGATGLTINGDITGSGDLIKGQYLSGNSGQLTLAANVTTSGNVLVNNGIITLANTSSMTFKIGEDGVSNKIGGTGTVNLNGQIIFDLSMAAEEDGNTWLVVDAGTENYGSGFSVQGFNQSGADWTFGGYTFSQGTGVLTYVVPEPSSAALLLGSGALLFMRRSRRGA
jgi:hypothetical protein